MPPRFKAYPKDYYQSQLFPANVFDLLPEDHECFLYQETVRATGHVGSGGPVQRPGPARLRAASDRVDPDLRLQPRRVQLPADRAALPGGSGVHVHRGEELPELPGVERFPEGPRGILPVLLQADGATGDGAGAGEFWAT